MGDGHAETPAEADREEGCGQVSNLCLPFPVFTPLLGTQLRSTSSRPPSNLVLMERLEMMQIRTPLTCTESRRRTSSTHRLRT